MSPYSGFKNLCFATYFAKKSEHEKQCKNPK